MRRLWVRRRIEPLHVLPGTVYKYPTLTVCQQHLDEAVSCSVFFTGISLLSVTCRASVSKLRAGLRGTAYCATRNWATRIFCCRFLSTRQAGDQLARRSRGLCGLLNVCFRLAWAKSLFSRKPCNNLVHKQQRWVSFDGYYVSLPRLFQRFFQLFERLTRDTATHYRLCLFHFPKSSFTESNDCIDFDQSSQPLSLVGYPILCSVLTSTSIAFCCRTFASTRKSPAVHKVW